MSILDDAIRAHLELKRAHGADESELKRLEDEAFGPPGRPEEPDPFAEPPTEFLATPEVGASEADAASAGGRRVPNITDLQEGPPPSAPTTGGLASDPAPEGSDVPAPETPDAPAVEDSPAIEQEAVADAPDVPAESTSKPDGVHTTEEREAIADQPTEFFDVEAEIQTGAVPGEAASPSDEQLIDAEMNEPKLAPPEPDSGIEASSSLLPDEGPAHDDGDDFFSEQRLSEELDNALEAPVTDEHEALPPLPAQTDEHEAVPEPPAPDPSDELELPPAPPQPTEEQTPLPPATEEGTAIYDVESEQGDDDVVAAPGHDSPPAVYEPKEEDHADALEETPDFLEDAPEDDDLWFEQRPPKDFDFDD